VTVPWIVAFAVLWVVVLLLLLVVLGLLRRVSEALERSASALTVDDVAVGAPLLSTIAPFDLVNADGQTVRFPALLPRTSIVLFVGSDCPACEVLLEQLSEVGGAVDGVPLLVVVEGLTTNAGRARLPAGLRVFGQRGLEASDAFNNRATPQAYTVDVDGVVLERRVPGALAYLREMAMHQQGKGGERAAAHQNETSQVAASR
jgi:hypothetical protein